MLWQVEEIGQFLALSASEYQLSLVDLPIGVFVALVEVRSQLCLCLLVEYGRAVLGSCFSTCEVMVRCNEAAVLHRQNAVDGIRARAATQIVNQRAQINGAFLPLTVLK